MEDRAEDLVEAGTGLALAGVAVGPDGMILLIKRLVDANKGIAR